MAAWLLGLWLLARGLVDERVLVNGSRYQDLVFQGTPWQGGRSWIEGGGKGNALFCDLGLGPGDFAVRVQLAIAKREATEAKLCLGASSIVLDGEKNAMTAGGPLFGGSSIPLGDAARRVADGKPFELEARREHGHLSILIDGQVACASDPGDEAVGRFGIAPEKARVLVYRFTVSGSLAPLPSEAPSGDLQPAVEAAIDRGVAWLLARQLRDGSWQNASASFPCGQTALAVYALLRSGLAKDHPAVARGLANLAAQSPAETYSLGLMLVAFEATADPAWHDKMRALVKSLVASQQRAGWSYAPAPRPGAVYDDALPQVDLSNTQYAVLGLRAAEHAGVEVPVEAWTRALEAALALQEPAADVEIPRKDGRAGTEKSRIAGFRYRLDRGASASMTDAGTAIVSICRDALGKKMKAETAAASQRSLETSSAWIAYRFNLEENYGPTEAQNQYYYLYGIERVGTLLGVERFGDHAWYLEGAKWLLAHQDKEGTWAVHGYGPTGWREIVEETDSCFAILFLRRASRPTVRTGPDPREQGTHVPKGATAPLAPWMLRAATGRERNLLLAQEVALSASTFDAAGSEASKALDGSQATAWVCAKDDPAPSITLEWSKVLKADELVLSPVCARPADSGRFDRITRASVRWNRDKEATSIDLPPDELEAAVVQVPKGAQLKRLEIRIEARNPGGAMKGKAGFAEIALERKP